MKLVLTGYSQEADLGSEPTMTNILIFNEGEIRLPVSEATIKHLLEVLYSPTKSQSPSVVSTLYDEDEEEEEVGGIMEDEVDEWGVGQV